MRPSERTIRQLLNEECVKNSNKQCNKNVENKRINYVDFKIGAIQKCAICSKKIIRKTQYLEIRGSSRPVCPRCYEVRIRYKK